jgi:hypothetical protein
MRLIANVVLFPFRLAVALVLSVFYVLGTVLFLGVAAVFVLCAVVLPVALFGASGLWITAAALCMLAVPVLLVGATRRAFRDTFGRGAGSRAARQR